MLAHLLKYDIAQGRYDGPHGGGAGEDNIVVDGKKITIYKNPNPGRAALGELGVDVVLECTGFTKKDKAMGPHPGRRQEGCDLCARWQRFEDHRVQRERENTLTKEDQIISAALLHHQLPGPDGKGPERRPIPSRAAL